MKTTLISFFVFTALFVGAVSGQKTEAPANPNYDEALAKRLGAD